MTLVAAGHKQDECSIVANYPGPSKEILTLLWGINAHLSAIQQQLQEINETGEREEKSNSLTFRVSGE